MQAPGRSLDGEYALGPLVVRPCTPVLGADLEGIDARVPPGGAALAALAEAVRRHRVVFLHVQDLATSELVAFGRALGTLQVYGTPGLPPELQVFAYGAEQRGRESFWHFDVLPSRQPARAALLYAREVPPVGGDTLFCDLGAAYAGLSAELRHRLEGAAGVYDLVFERRLARFRGATDAEAMALAGEPLRRWPLVVRLPYGPPVLFLNPSFLVGIDGMADAEWRAAAAEMRARIDRPELQCRHRWRAGDLALWDNRACLHYAASDYFPRRRVMERVSVVDAVGASFLEAGLDGARLEAAS